MNEERQKLIEQANALGLDFQSNIPTDKLKAMVAESDGPEVDPEADVDAPPETAKVEGKPLTLRQKIQASKKRALKLVVVTITNKDNRENDVMTTVPLSFENQYFGVARNVPLDVPVEIEQALINIAETTTMTLHKDEIVDGRRTGNKVPVTVKKFAVSYGRPTED